MVLADITGTGAGWNLIIIKPGFYIQTYMRCRGNARVNTLFTRMFTMFPEWILFLITEDFHSATWP